MVALARRQGFLRWTFSPWPWSPRVLFYRLQFWRAIKKYHA